MGFACGSASAASEGHGPIQQETSPVFKTGEVSWFVAAGWADHLADNLQVPGASLQDFPERVLACNLAFGKLKQVDAPHFYLCP